MKKILCITLCLFMIFFLFACSKNNQKITTTTTSTEKQTETTSTEVDETEKESTESETTLKRNINTTVKSTKPKSTTEPTNDEKNETSSKEEKVAVKVENLLDDGKIVQYDLEAEEYYKFVSNPSQSYLNKITERFELEVYFTSIREWDGKIRIHKKHPLVPESFIFNEPEGVERLGMNPPMPVFKSLIDFGDDSNSLKDYLNKKGLKETPKCTTFIYSSGYQPTIWLQTDKNSYFLTIDGVDDYGEYTYSFYTLKAFEEKLRPLF